MRLFTFHTRRRRIPWPQCTLFLVLIWFALSVDNINAAQQGSGMDHEDVEDVAGAGDTGRGNRNGASNNIGLQSLLVEATKANDPIAIKRAVMKMGGDMEHKGAGGQTPLMLATLLGNLEAVETLIDLGANTLTREEQGYNVIHAASFQGRANIIELFTKYNYEYNGRHKDGYFPFHRACWGKERRHTETVKLFLELRIDPEIKAANGKTCLDMTQNPDTIAIVEAAIRLKHGTEIKDNSITDSDDKENTFDANDRNADEQRIVDSSFSEL